MNKMKKLVLGVAAAGALLSFFSIPAVATRLGTMVVTVLTATSTTSVSIPVWFNIASGQDFYCRTGNVVGTGRAVVIREK